MRLLNEKREEVLESDVDLSLGEIVEAVIIKEDATPIDNVTKFAWYDEDYEKVKIYRKFTEGEIQRLQKAKEAHDVQDDTDAMLIDHEYRLTLLELFTDMTV